MLAGSDGERLMVEEKVNPTPTPWRQRRLQIVLGACAVAFVSNANAGDSTQEDDIRNILSGRIVVKELAQAHAKTTKLGLLGEGQEKDLSRAIATAFATFAKSSNETVKSQISEFDPKAEEDKVKANLDEIKEIYAETGEEAKMLAKWMKPDKAGK
ncbi:hypothetical protein GUITHDRAFT_137638 [Guillardia theta CCMP2712]|uniref:Uncharacterized protein n=1 Tax=Guillardia theta (strain CCMP2712) TaxID=905079 RepID=L1JG41_GUITC|nr:hypothetical protein GUITHDRAFT_137638 [Guillardia theta CCMP2712]EKX47488.1 hypothetical protein GUITHDRAFT_137638 [Guillardia theta CCMP2712]|eukprot:XP_005834468.1 hypothetical protein GUITHDRAFT_137638 [Guillardia theta CCMP2712]